MKSFLSFANSKLPHRAAALGKFDGMHMAHLRLLELLGDDGAAISVASVKPPFIMPPQIRQRYSAIEFYRIRLDLVRDLSAKSFLELLFFIMPRLEKIAVGYDFCFGKNRSSSVLDIRGILDSMGRKDTRILILEPQKYNDTPIHTSIIKELIKYGDMAAARGMLGRLYSIRGIVIKGQGIGSKELYPTINVRNSLYVLPKFGVYATFSILRGVMYKSVSFIGHRVSLDSKFAIETHIIDRSDICASPGESIELRFAEMIRNNMKFDSLHDLKDQIQRDIASAKRVLTAL